MAIILVRAASPGLSDAAAAVRDIGGISHHGMSLQCSSLLKRRSAPARRWMLCSLRYGCLGLDPWEVGRASPPAVYSSLAVNPAGEAAVSSEQKVYDVVIKQAALLKRQLRKPVLDVRLQDLEMPRNGLKEAYDRCGEICEEYAKTFYLGIYLSSQSTIP